MGDITEIRALSLKDGTKIVDPVEIRKVLQDNGWTVLSDGTLVPPPKAD